MPIVPIAIVCIVEELQCTRYINHFLFYSSIIIHIYSIQLGHALSNNQLNHVLIMPALFE